MSLKLSATVNDAEKHECDITSLIFKNNKVYSAADDGKIKMWSTDLKLEKEIQAHSCSVYSITADNSNHIYSCSSDGSVRSWKADTLEKVAIIQQTGDQEMWKIYWADDKLIVVDDRGIVLIYKDNKIIAIVEMLEQIKDVAIKDKFLYTVRDLDLVITEILPGDKGRYTCCGTLPGRAPLFLLDDKLCFSSRDGREIFVNYRNSNRFALITKITNAHEMMLNAISGGQCGDVCYLYSGGWDKNVKQWRLVSGGATETACCDLEGYVNVICVNDDGRKVFAGGAGGKIWSMEAQ